MSPSEIIGDDYEALRPETSPYGADDSTVMHMLRRMVVSQPECIAVEDELSTLSYESLWLAASNIARAIGMRGLGPGSAIGVVVSRRSHDIAILLGILLSGAAYVALDPQYPTSRLKSILENSNADLLLGSGESLQTTGDACGVDVLPLEDVPQTDSVGLADSGIIATGASLCYLLYTSGSTGVPKGVRMPHRAMRNLIEWQIADSCATIGSRTVQFSPLSFDVSFQEIFSTLCAGGTLICVPEHIRVDPYSYWLFIHAHSINRMFMPFTALQSLALARRDLPHFTVFLAEVITAGEQLVCTEPIRALFRQLAGCVLVNQYGPVETHVVSRHRLQLEPDSWEFMPPIGTPISNVQIALIDADGMPISNDDEGEICISGAALSDGYQHQDSLTSERFPNLGPKSRRHYRTGDIGRRSGSNYYFIRRLDDQVKVAGYRVELAEVEGHITSLPGVLDAAVVAAPDDGGAMHLIAYVSGAFSTEDLQQIRLSLSRTLPRYMVPAKVVLRQKLPRTTSGKLDRRFLTDDSAVPEYEQISGANSDQVRRAQLLDLLGTEVDFSKSFVEAGGSSLLAARLVSMLNGVDRDRLTVGQVLQASSLIELCRTKGRLSRTVFGSGQFDSVRPVRDPVRDLLIADALRGATGQHVVFLGMDVHGDVSKVQVLGALRRVMSHHCALHSRYLLEGDIYVQRILDLDTTSALVLIDEDALSDYQFNLEASASPAVSIREYADRLSITVLIHHVVADGLSLQILFDDFCVELEADTAHSKFHTHNLVEEPLPALVDAGVASELSCCYWMARASGGSMGGRVGLQRPRRAQRLAVEATPELMGLVQMLAQRHGVTTYSVLLASWLMTAGSGPSSEEKVVAVPLAGRLSTDEIEQVGNFVNVVPLIVEATDLNDFGTLVRNVQERIAEGQEHQPLPRRDSRGVSLKARMLLGRAPTMFVSNPYSVTSRVFLNGTVVSRRPASLLAEPTLHSLVVSVADHIDGESWIDYAPDDWSESSVLRVWDEFLVTIYALAAADDAAQNSVGSAG